jgi:hypothetical protein
MFEWIEAVYNPAVAIPAWATAAPQSWKPFTPLHSPRHDQRTERVRGTGSGSHPTDGAWTEHGQELKICANLLRWSTRWSKRSTKRGRRGSRSYCGLTLPVPC